MSSLALDPEIPARRLVKLTSSSEFALAGASDENAFGVTWESGSDRCVRLLGSTTSLTYKSGDPPPSLGSPLGQGPYVLLEAQPDVQVGGVVYQAANGLIAPTGTVRVGIAVELVATDPEIVWKILPD